MRMNAGTLLEQPSALASWAASGFGAELVPVCGPHHDCQSPGKRPHLSGWQTMDVTPEVRALWERDHRGNTGLRTRSFPCVDIDVDAPELVKAIEVVCLEVLGPAPARFRANSARRALLYRLEGEPFDKAALSFTTPDGVKAKVEILAAGQQVVVAGRHASGADLEWTEPPRANGLASFAGAQVPTLLAELRRWLEEAGCTFAAPPTPARPAPAVRPLRAFSGDEAERARRIARGYVATIDPAISEAGGHPQTMHIACRIVERVTSEADAWEILVEANESKCLPPWSERELKHKLESALEKHQLGEKLPALLARKDERRQNLPQEPSEVTPTPVYTMAELLAKELQRIEHGVPVIPTGFARFDEALGGGFQDPSLNVCGAGPKALKSTWAQVVAARHAERGGAVFYLDLENGATRFLRRLLCRRSGLGMREVTAAMKDPEAAVFTSRDAGQRWREAQAWAASLPILSMFAPPTDLEAELRRAKAMAPGRTLLAVLDSLQKLPGNLEDRRATVDGWLRLLERLRLELPAVILVISEIRRGKEGYVPSEDAFKESGSIEYTADLAFTMNRAPADEDGQEAISTLRVQLARDCEEDPRGDVASYRPVRPHYGIEEIEPVAIKKPRRTGPKAEKAEGARAFLEARLAASPVAVEQLVREGEAEGFSRSVLYRVKAELGLRTATVGLKNGWRLP